MTEINANLNKINNYFCSLSSNAKDLYLPREIPILNNVPEPLEFYRNWVAPNIPFKVKGGVSHWPALKKWNELYLCETLKDKHISVAVTPNGYADAIADVVVDNEVVKCFVLPEERTMLISDFFDKLKGKQDFPVQDSSGIFYIQKQNSNLTEEFPELLSDIDEQLKWASEAFNSKPAAINLWIGDGRAVTSLHKDPFENIYCVVSGYKDFILFPPTDRPWLPYVNVPVGQYKEIAPGKFGTKILTSSNWKTTDFEEESISQEVSLNENDNKLDKEMISWIDIDPLFPNFKKYPSYVNATPIKVRVECGDLLYLPSLWFHHVSQSHGCIAVNYWYDMNFDIKFAYFQFLEKLSANCS